jgi:hypothetical protein
MTMLSEDDVNLRELSDEELALAWDLWFDLAQTTNDDDPPYTHGVFQTAGVAGASTDLHRAPGEGGGGCLEAKFTTVKTASSKPRVRTRGLGTTPGGPV